MTSTSSGAPRTSGRSTLFGYAVLRANYNHNAPNYLDNFTGFVLDVLAQRHPEPVDEATVGQTVRETFGLTIPDRVVGLLLKRAVKERKAERADRIHFSLSEKALAGVASLEASIAEFEHKQAELLAKFLAFVRERHPERLALIADEPESHLHAFIEQQAVPLLRRAVKGRRSEETDWEDLQGPDYLVAAFIATLVEGDAQTFGYVVDAVKGAILTGVLDIGPGDLRQNLRDLTIILDTPVLLKALGYQGEAQCRAVRQTLDLAHTLGVTTTCFEHTEKEIDGVLESVGSVLRSRGKATNNLRAVDAHFLDSGSTPADIAVEQNGLRTNLQRLGVRVVNRPEDYYTYGLDETALDDLLRDHLPGQKEVTRRYDVQSISAVHRLRRGSSPESFERCGYVLMTDNTGLVAASRRVDERHRWPLAMLDSDVAALLWVRGPAVAEDLPRDQLLATVYSGMQPGGHLWLKYVEEIERLQQRGAVNEDEALVLRSRPEARRALMDVTLGEADSIDAESITTVVERVRETLEAPLRDVINHTQAERDAALRSAQEAAAVAQHQQAEAAKHAQTAVHVSDEVKSLRNRLADAEEQRREQSERLRAQAQKRARRWIIAFLLLVGAALAIFGGLALLLPHLGARWPAWIGIAGIVSGVAIAVLGAVRIVVGGSVKDWLKPVESRLAARLERKARERAGVPREPS
jgi:hypothetical protein